MGLKRLFVWLLGLYQANNIVSAGWLVWMELGLKRIRLFWQVPSTFAFMKITSFIETAFR